MRKRRVQALAAAVVLAGGGVAYYVVHERQIAACKPAVRQADALWAQSSAIVRAVMNSPPNPTPGPQTQEQINQPQTDLARSNAIDDQAAAVVLAHPSCFDSYTVSNARSSSKP